MNTVILNPQSSFSSQVTFADTIYVITGEMDLNNSSLNDNLMFEMPNNCVLKFAGGLIKNGVIYGTNTRIDNPYNSVIFNNVELRTDIEFDDPNNPKTYLSPVTGWLGECRDIWFHYNESSPAHYTLVKSVCQFERCLFSPRTYYLERWETVLLRPYSCVINGGGAVFIITENKGNTSPTGWNGLDEYLPTCLFYKHSPNRYGEEYISGKRSGRFHVSDLTILDNNTLEEVPQGWGEDFSNSAGVFVFYTIFKGCGNHTVFRNVKYDGRGGLWAHYNYEVAIQEVAFIDCDIRTSQFAMELGNARRAELSNRYPYGGSCNTFRISHCRIFNYAANVLVGPLSVVNQEDYVESSITRAVLIEDSYFESESINNLELSGARFVRINNCTFLSVFCSSERATFFDSQSIEHPVNKEFHVIGNSFGNPDYYAGEEFKAYLIDAGDIYFTNNIVTADFGIQNKPKGNIVLRGYGNNIAVVSGNTFIIKNTNNGYFKSLLFYENTILDLIGNTYCFLEGVKQGNEVAVGGRGGFYNLEVEDDPRFFNSAGGGFPDWNYIPFSQRTPEGYLQIGETLVLTTNQYEYDPSYSDIPDSPPVPIKAFEFDLYVHLQGLERNGLQTFARFSTGKIVSNSERIPDVFIQTNFSSFQIGVASGNPSTIKYYKSDVGAVLAFPFWGMDTCKDNLGIIRIVFINETLMVQNNSETVTRVILYMNDYQIDTFLLAHQNSSTQDYEDVQNVLTNGVFDINLLGISYVRIKNYRLRTQVKTLPNPVVAHHLTEYPNIGYAKSGPSSGRPIMPEVGFSYFDTSLGKPIFFNGNNWIDSDGTNIVP